VLKKSITYTDFNDNEVTEEFHFHLSPPDLISLESSYPGGFEKHVDTIMASKDGGQILNLFQKLIQLSIGRVSEDGKRFEKSEEIRNAFLQTNAYSALFMELGSSEETAAAFWNAIMPKDLAAQIEKIERPGGSQAERAVVESTPVRHEKVMTQAEAVALDQDRLIRRMKDGWVIQS
jgi:hypothetical protein